MLGAHVKRPPGGGLFALSESQPNDTAKGLWLNFSTSPAERPVPSSPVRCLTGYTVFADARGAIRCSLVPPAVMPARSTSPIFEFLQQALARRVSVTASASAQLIPVGATLLKMERARG